jgi:DNA repair exonuclease SbcCD ATPase subunit
MSSISDRISTAAYDRLKAENKKLQQALELERARRESVDRELARLHEWTDKIIGPITGRLADDISATRRAQERISSTMSEQFDQLQNVVGNVETAVGNVGTRLAGEIEQVRLEIERLNNQNPSIDLTPAIQRLNGVEQNLNSLGEQIGGIIADQQPEPPAPAPEGRRR